MPRKLIPKTRGGGRYTEAAFWAFVRSGLRQKWSRWGPRYDALAAARRPSKSSNLRLKWEFQCSQCKRWFAQKGVEVDHIVPCGSLRCWADLAGFAERLFVEVTGLRVVCKPCHHTITQQEKS